MNIWRIHKSTSKCNDISDYCIKNHVAAIGWSLLEFNGNLEELAFQRFEDYYKYACTFYTIAQMNIVKRFATGTTENDIIWMRSNGIYYCARVKRESKWIFNIDRDAREIDASNQLTNIDWIKVGDESVPGALTTSFIQGSTFQRIRKPGVAEFSEITYDNLSNDSFKYNRDITLTQKTFYSLISPADCEDLLYMWLYHNHNKNYACIPSTNKIATPKYEFVIMDVETGKHIYVQVKNGEKGLNANDYLDLVENSNNEVYLLSTGGKVINADQNANINEVDPTELFDFACEENNQKYIPPNIDFWMQFAGGNNTDFCKGIMFDTNYANTNDKENYENYMFNNNVIAAWGYPKKYIKSFKKNDYVLYYRKGCGIIAAGIITSDEPKETKEIPNGLEHTVQIIISEKDDSAGNIISITPKEIKDALNKGFYFASTRKVPFLTTEETKTIIDLLSKKQQFYN